MEYYHEEGKEKGRETSAGRGKGAVQRGKG
jgi:hypothetical protein